MITKERKLLIKSGWLKDYYYIKKVMEGNRTSTNPMHEINTFKWGKEVLQRKETSILPLRMNYAFYENFKREIGVYYNNMRDLHEIVLDTIIENGKDIKKNNNGKEIENSN